MRTSIILCLSLQAFAGSYSISTIAGSDWVGENVLAISAILQQAEGIATDQMGNIYVSDAANHRVRKISNGIITTIAGDGMPGFAGDNGPASSSQLNSPYGLAFDFAGNLYIADLGNARIRRVTPAGIISTAAGGGSLPAGGKNEGSMATVVSFVAPRNVTVDGSGVLYISDFGAHRVYKMTTDGTLTTLAGTGSAGYSGDGVASQNELNYPTGLAVDHQGIVYIADSGNHLVRKVAGGWLTSIGRASLPTGLAFDGVATLYVADHSADQIIEIPLSSGTSSAMNVPAADLAYGNDGHLYVANVTDVLRATVFGSSTVIAGGGSLAEGDGGQATQARLNHPTGMTIDSIGNLYIADHDNNRIRRVGVNGVITTIAGTGAKGNAGDGGSAELASLNGPSSVALDSLGDLYIADTGNARIRMVTPGGIILPVSTGALVAPAYMMFDSANNFYIADQSAIYKITPAGVTSMIAAGLESPQGMVIDASGNFYFSESGAKQVWMFAPSGNHSQVGAGVWSSPQGLALDGSGNLIVADSGLNQIVSVNSFGQATPIAGTGTAGFAGDGGSALTAQLNTPTALLFAGSNLFAADTGNGRIRELTGAAFQQTAAPILVVSAVNAASLSPGPIAPGMLMALLGTGLTSADAPNTQVLFNTTSAPILSIDSTEVLVRVPVTLQGLSTVQITINNQNMQIAQIIASVVDAAPALFASSTGQASVINQDGTLNTSSNPAQPGSVISIFGTGEGITGLPFSVLIAGYSLTILYAGPAGNYPGMFQINAVVPSGFFTGGTLPIVAIVGSNSTQSGVTVTVF